MCPDRHPIAATVVCLHFLGGSRREWASVAARLGETVECVALDLPGFGDAASEPSLSLGEMADRIAETLRGRLHGPWWLVGHSMGAKVALVLAHRAEAGDADLAGLAGLALVAGSPPSPEPMSDDRRAEMIAWIDEATATKAQKACRFIADNVGSRLEHAVEVEAVEDVMRANPIAWKAWLTGGSREDWCRRIGVLRTPALILSGAADADLGPDAQEALMAPHLVRYDHVVLEGAGHLLPLERPNTVADHIAALIEGRDPVLRASPEARGDQDYRDLIASDRVNMRLRAALHARAEIDDPAYRPESLDPVELAILRAACDRVLPQLRAPLVDIAARIDARLSRGAGDGWRFVSLPEDAPAYRWALRRLDEVARTTYGGPFVTRDAPTRDALLRAIDGGHLEGQGDGFDQEHLSLWFQDLRADVVRVYLAHPAALARLGFSGIGAGGDDPAHLSGFQHIGIGERDPWEPAADDAR